MRRSPREEAGPPGPQIPREHDHVRLSAIGYACKLPLGRMNYYSTALVRRAIRYYVLHMMHDRLVGEDVNHALANPWKWYLAAREALAWRAMERDIKRRGKRGKR